LSDDDAAKRDHQESAAEHGHADTVLSHTSLRWRDTFYVQTVRQHGGSAHRWRG
jgi:hypothetical protein